MIQLQGIFITLRYIKVYAWEIIVYRKEYAKKYCQGGTQRPFIYCKHQFIVESKRIHSRGQKNYGACCEFENNVTKLFQVSGVCPICLIISFLFYYTNATLLIALKFLQQYLYLYCFSNVKDLIL